MFYETTLYTGANRSPKYKFRDVWHTAAALLRMGIPARIVLKRIPAGFVVYSQGIKQ